MADQAQRGLQFRRYSLPSLLETENIPGARSASSLIFRPSSRSSNRSNETIELDKNSDLQSGGKKRKVSSDSKLSQKKVKEKKRTKWGQSEEMLKFVREYKSTCDFKGIDYEADLQSLYTEVRRCIRVCILMTLEVVSGGRVTLPVKFCL